MMLVQPFWITPSLAIIPRPRGGDWLDDEMLALRKAGIHVIVSTLPADEAAELGLEREREAAIGAGLQFLNYPIHDRSVPSRVEDFITFLSDLAAHIAAGCRVGVHCRACIGRSSVTAAGVLIRSGMPSTVAWQTIAAARGFPVPDTQEQRAWVDRNITPAP